MTSDIFIQHLQGKIEPFIDSFKEKDEYGITSFEIQLSDGVDKDQFIYSVIEFLKKNPTEDTFDIWINAYGEDFNTQASCLPINADFGEGRDLDGMEEDVDESFEVEVDGEILEINPLEDGTFVVWKGEEHLGIIMPDNGADTTLIWRSQDLMTDEYAQAIGEAIERFER